MRMDIRRWDPFRDIAELQQGVNQMFDQMRTRSSQESPRANTWSPACDVIEDENEIRVMVELPGIKMEDIDLEVTSDALIIQGERVFEKFEGEDKREWVRVERPYGKFSRSFSISVPIDVQKVKASYKDGILTVAIPKSEDVKPKRISVEAG